jgi:hypothetical protein
VGDRGLPTTGDRIHVPYRPRVFVLLSAPLRQEAVTRGGGLPPAGGRAAASRRCAATEGGEARAQAKAGAQPKPEPVAKKVDLSAAQRDGALALLALLQRDGRLVDFLREPLDGFADADIGAAARDVHRGCKKVLDQYFTLEPVLPGADDAKVTVPKGFDPAEIRVIGEAKGEPPFAGALRHHGWRAAKAQLPTLADGVDRAIVAPAEVELS